MATEKEPLARWDAEAGQWKNSWNLGTFRGQPADAGLQPDGRYFLDLERPIQLGTQGEPRARIIFQPPNGKAFREKPLQPHTSGEIMVWAGKHLCGLTTTEIDLLVGKDCSRFEEVAAAFFVDATEIIGSPPLVQFAQRILPGAPKNSSS